MIKMKLGKIIVKKLKSIALKKKLEIILLEDLIILKNILIVGMNKNQEKLILMICIII